MCCDPIEPRPNETVGKCPKCGVDVDAYGISTEAGCSYSPTSCSECEDCPCDQSC